MRPFDIAPFAFPNCPVGEVRFEEPRDMARVVVSFAGPAPGRVGLSYLRKNWPGTRLDTPYRQDIHRPFSLGWCSTDDQFNAVWQKAKVKVARVSATRAELTFAGLLEEIPDFPDADTYDVTFRRTLGIRVDAPASAKVRRVQIFTTSTPVRTRLRIELDAGRRTPGDSIHLGGYNANVREIQPIAGVRTSGRHAILTKARGRSFLVTVDHMAPLHEVSGDDGHVSFRLDGEMFTISLASLAQQGPIWFAEMGVYITRAADTTSFARYRSRNASKRTVAQQVRSHPEQSLAAAMQGQPRAHATPFIVGCRHARQRYWITPYGDVLLRQLDMDRRVAGRDVGRFRNDRAGRLGFSLHEWSVIGRSPGPGAMPAYNIRFERDGVELEQRGFAVPLSGTFAAELAGDDTTCALVRFRFTNRSSRPARAELPVSYSSSSGVEAIPDCPRDPISASAGRIRTTYRRKQVLRCAYQTAMVVGKGAKAVVFSKRLAPGATCELVLKVPLIALESREELAALEALGFATCDRRFRTYWLAEASRGAKLTAPDSRLTALHELHLPIVEISDVAMPDDPALINTSVGTGVYGNFANESCMIIQELTQRGLIDEARRRLDVWLKYQSTVGLTGNFSDHLGVYYGAGGYECGQHYNQHHGWVLWALAEHYLYTRDEKWLAGIADSLVAACDWVFRQRRLTMGRLPHSRGWERGFLPAGGLEDVGDYAYWLPTNALTWRGTDAAAKALRAAGHPQARRIARESNAYRRDLLAGFETMRRHAPLVRLRDGRWAPHYPSRLYRRGRDVGWIRETLEGSIYLLISGLLSPTSRQGGWICDDYHDNRYMSPPFGYPIDDPQHQWFHRGGFSMQPNLLAGLLPHLDRDEPDIYIWMYFNALASCYRPETGALIEHPMPCLGFSNDVPFKTSDQANSVMWLRYMFVYPGRHDTLHIGKAIPRGWFAQNRPFGLKGVLTPFGRLSVEYTPSPATRTITADIKLSLHTAPKRVSLRFRHPQSKPIRKVTVNGKDVRPPKRKAGDIDLTGLSGRLRVEVRY